MRALLAMFVDDGSLAAVTLLWVAAAAFAGVWLDPVPDWIAPLFALGLAAALLANVGLAARRKSLPGRGGDANAAEKSSRWSHR